MSSDYMTDQQLEGIRESYRELTKADLREAREAENASDGDGEAEDEVALSEAQSVLAAMDANREMTVAAIAEAAGIGTPQLRPLPRALIDAGRVEQTGLGRGTRYRLAGRQEGSKKAVAAWTK